MNHCGIVINEIWCFESSLGNLMRLLVILSTLISIGLIVAKQASADTNSPSQSLCMVAVENGRPTSADRGQVFRMVIVIDVIPRLEEIYIQPLNRVGRWTVDSGGTYRPFRGIFPTRGLPTQRQWVVDRSGRVIGANPTDLFVMGPQDDTFQHLLALKDFDTGNTWQLEFEPHTGVVYLGTSRDLYELRGNALVRSNYASEALERGFGLVYPPHFLPALDAHLFESRAGLFVLRDRNGSWKTLYALKCGYNCRNYVPEVVGVVSENLVVVKTAKEVFAIDITDSRHPRAIGIIKDDRNLLLRSMRLSTETGAFLIYNGRAFHIISADSRFPSVRRDGSWLLRLTREGVQPVPGSKIVPTKSPTTNRQIYFPRFVDLPGRGQVLIFAENGIGLFEGNVVRMVPDSGPNTLGFLPRPVILESIDRVIIVSTLGLFELTTENELVELRTPFDASGPYRPKFVDAPHLGVAFVLTKEGIYSINQNGRIDAIPGSGDFSLGGGSKGLAVLPGAGDLLIQGSDALWILKSGLCGIK